MRRRRSWCCLPAAPPSCALRSPTATLTTGLTRTPSSQTGSWRSPAKSAIRSPSCRSAATAVHGAAPAASWPWSKCAARSLPCWPPSASSPTPALRTCAWSSCACASRDRWRHCAWCPGRELRPSGAPHSALQSDRQLQLWFRTLTTNAELLQTRA